MKEDMRPYLIPTEIIDSDNELIRNYANDIVKNETNLIEIAVKLYLAVRDNIRYDPYAPFYRPEHYRASCVLMRGKGFCIPKASLLCALGRACGIPSRVGFATVRNHLTTKQFLEFLGTDKFVYHGFVEFFLSGKWVKATPAFNKELCIRHKVPPLEFNGREDSLFQAYNMENQKFMEYIEFKGIYADIPFDEILKAFKDAYGEERIKNWIRMFEEREGHSLADFESEDVVNE